MLPARHWPIGLDIGADGVKVLQFRRSGASLAVGACGRFRFPEGAADDPEQRHKLAVKAVRNMFRQGGFQGRRVVTALSCHELGVKNIRIPNLAEGTREMVIRSEATERFGFEVSADQLKYLVAGQVRSGNETQHEVIVMVARDETIHNHLAMLDEMGLRVEHIEAAPLAVFRVFERSLRRRADESTVSVVVDIGATGTRVVVARGRQVVFVKQIGIGGRRLTEVVARQLNLTQTEAHEMRMRAGPTRPSSNEGAEQGQTDVSSVDWTIHDAVRGEVESLARQITLCLRYCSVTFRGLRPQQVILTGGEVYDASLVRFLSEELGLECVVGHPLRGIDLSAVDLGADRRSMLAEWTMCAGLAMRGIRSAGLAGDLEHARDRLSA